ncbi:hypothetical protein GPA22_05190 [Aromatoleum toluvorans]|uniref:Uncharacterized protein n=1 Tax=Aromatoleum toluvorans TaxID=92002 RepID=A0ABX1PUU3_9RHOO|nr:hypothetical protein [Aromatoleum toluvorans]NMG43123.1 hypothetical protein [Aromatoleum toluvorans]
MLALILSTGPQIQNYALSLLNSGNPSIYASVYGEELIKFPRLMTWIRAGFEWQFLLAGAAVAFVCVRQSAPRMLAWRVSVATFMILCLVDAANAVVTGSATLDFLVKNLVSNGIGAVFLGALVLSFLRAADLLYSNLEVGAFSKRLTASLAILIAGFLTSCSVYYVCELLFSPRPTEIKAYFATPSSGTIVPRLSNELGSPSKEGRVPFSFFSSLATAGNATWTNINGDLQLTLLQEKASQKYHVDIHLISGCNTFDAINGLDFSRPWMTFDEVTTLQASTDTGITQFLAGSLQGHHTKIKVDSGKVGFFDFKRDSQSNSLSLTQFVGDDAHLELSSYADDLLFAFSASFLNKKNDELANSPRFLNLKIDKTTYVIQFVPPLKSPSNKEVTCKVLEQDGPAKNSQRSYVEIDGRGLLPGVLLRLRPSDLSGIRRVPAETTLRVQGADGWIAVHGLEIDSVAGQPLGHLKMFHVRGNILNFILDESSTAVQPFDTYTAIGELQGNFSADGNLLFSGRADSLWKGNVRANLTRWERLSWEAKVFLLGLLGSFVTFMGSLCSRWLRENRPISWITYAN